MISYYRYRYNTNDSLGTWQYQLFVESYGISDVEEILESRCMYRDEPGYRGTEVEEMKDGFPPEVMQREIIFLRASAEFNLRVASLMEKMLTP